MSLHYIVYRASNDKDDCDDELTKVWKEAGDMVNIYLGGGGEAKRNNEKYRVRIAGLHTEIRNPDLLKTKQEHVSYREQMPL